MTALATLAELRHDADMNEYTTRAVSVMNQRWTEETGYDRPAAQYAARPGRGDPARVRL